MRDTTKQWTLLATIFLGPIVLFLLAYVLMTVFNERFLASNYPKSLRIWVEILAPPDDLYLPSAEEHMERTESGWKVVVQPNHKYLGPYLVRLLSSDGRYYRASNASYSITCSSAINIFQDTGKVKSPLGTFDHETGRSISGAGLSDYRIPEDFALHEEVSCRVVLQEDQEGEDLAVPVIRIGRRSQK